MTISSIHLPVFRSNAAFDAQDLLPRLSQRRVAAKDALAFSRACRVQGIAGLFQDGVPEPLHRELCRSGRAMLHALGRMDDTEKATGGLFPFFDAIAACDFDCARGIAGLARANWNQDEEYEDDFLYVHGLMKHFFLGADPAERDALAARWEAVLGGTSDVRLDVSRALWKRSAGDFEGALVRLLGDEKARIGRLRRADALAPEIEATEGHLSVEGIALVRLARWVGMKTGSNYWGVPSIALKESRPVFSGDAWQGL
ncbi:Imm49 family immunity protein [Sorangium sp. So ce367]|uniref:Imm49 family immunity protein n=1 Tax=Sorangium sp. So ce367 TaxID=3133305 RepID=UPI003F5E0747